MKVVTKRPPTWRIPEHLKKKRGPKPRPPETYRCACDRVGVKKKYRIWVCSFCDAIEESNVKRITKTGMTAKRRVDFGGLDVYAYCDGAAIE